MKAADRPPRPHDPAADRLTPPGLLDLPVPRRRQVAGRVLAHLAEQVGIADVHQVRTALLLLAQGELPTGPAAQQLAAYAETVADRYADADDAAIADPDDLAAREQLAIWMGQHTVAVGLWYLTQPDRSTIPEITAVVEAGAEILDDLPELIATLT